MRKAFLLAAGLLCGAALVAAEPLPVRPLMLGHLPMFDLKVAGGAATGSSSGGASGTGTANTVAKFTGASTLGNSTITDDGILVTVNTASTFRSSVATDGTTNFLSLTGTIPTVPTATINGLSFTVNSAGSASFVQVGAIFTLGAGYTGSSRTTTATFQNSAAGTGANSFAASNRAIFASTTPTTTGTNVGLSGSAANGNVNMSVTGQAVVNKASAVNIGGAFYAKNTGGGGTSEVAVYGVLNNADPSLSSVNAAALFDNSTEAAPIIVARDNGAALPTTGAANTFAVLDGAQAQAGNEVLTSGTMTAANQAELRTVTHAYQWTNAMIVALGASLTGDISVATLPAKTIVKNAYVVLNSTCAGTATLTVAVGRTSALYIDYIVASNAQSGANTVYGDSSGERGTNLTGYDLPSYTGTTVVNAHFISTVSNLSAVTTCTGTVILETALAP